MARLKFTPLVLFICFVLILVNRPISGADPEYDPHDFQAMIDHFRATRQVDGSGVTIAVIDTGIDPGLDALRRADRSRLIEWVDFTAEGRVNTSHKAQAEEEFLILTGGQRVRLGARRSRSGVYRYGWFEENSLPADSGFKGDLNGNGSNRDRFLVVLVDSLQPGVYDTVYVDTHNNSNLADENPVFVYSRLREHLTFPAGQLRPGVSVVVAEIQTHGGYVKFGFDGHGHGTQVASIAAAGPSESGVGVAPGVRLMALKALTSDGFGTWTQLRGAMQYAAENGADIALVSATGITGGDTGEEGRLMDELSREHGTLFVLVAGNDGPGLGTISSNLAAEHALIVGAYATPALMEEFFDIEIPRTIVMHYSGAGPAGDVLPGPSLIAPAMARTLMPAWSEEPDGIIDGTSVAAPYVAGGAALLMEALHRQGIGATVTDLGRALKYGAVPVRNYDPLEQGFGVPNVSAAYQLLSQGAISPHYVSITGEASRGGHFSVRRHRPAETVFQLVSASTQPFHLSANGVYRVQPEELWLTPAGERTLRVETKGRPFPGRLASERLNLVDEDGAIINSALISHINPHRGRNMSWSARLEAGMRDRKFVCVDEGTTLMVMKVGFPPDRDGMQGLGEVFVYDPAGNLAAHSGLLGFDRIKSEEYIMLTTPAPGVWEIVVVMDVRTGWELPRAPFSLAVELEGYEITPIVAPEPDQHSLRLSRVGTTTTAQLDVVEQLGQSAVTLTVLARSTVFRSLSVVPDGLDELIIRTSHPTVIGANVNLYLYHFDPQHRRWIEVAASATAGTAEEWIIIEEPPPGNYLAYVEAVDLKGASEVSFRFEEYFLRSVPMVVEPRQVTLSSNQSTGIVISYPESEAFRNPQLHIKENDYAIFATLVSIPSKASGNLLINLQQGVRNQGQESSALLTVLCGEKLRAVNVLAVVNGRSYPVENGRAVIDILDDERQLVVRLVGERGEVMVELAYPVTREVAITHDYIDDGDAYRRFINHMGRN